MRVWLNLRHRTSERQKAFARGFERLGYIVVDGVTHQPGSRDILCTWNRIHVGHSAARAFEAAGRPVLVTENAAWGNGFLGGEWLTLSNGHHNRADGFPEGGPERWDQLGVDLAPWRTEGEAVILPSRGIGAGGMPRGWGEDMRRRTGARLRPHPGRSEAIPLQRDLARAGKVITWGSGAAIKALLWGIPVESHMPGWIGEQQNTDASRLAMFRRLAWATWRMEEIASGEAFSWLLPSPA